MDKILDFIKKHIGIIKVYLFIGVIALIAIIFINFIYAPIVVVGDSMNPSLRDGDVVGVNMLATVFDDIERFDIVCFPYKYNKNSYYIKRVIGLPGDTIEIINDEIFINGEKLLEFYGYYDKEVTSKYGDIGPINLSIDEYFVMGDNRNVSDDSRSEDIGVVKKETITGVATFRFWPFDGIGSLEYQ